MLKFVKRFFITSILNSLIKEYLLSKRYTKLAKKFIFYIDFEFAKVKDVTGIIAIINNNVSIIIKIKILNAILLD